MALQRNMAASMIMRSLVHRNINNRVSYSFVRGLKRTVNLMGAYDTDFEKAKERLNTLKEDPGNQAKLKIYALFKQSTIGKCNAPKPGMMDFVGKAKWEAWNGLGDMSQDDAKKTYIEFINSLAGSEPASESAAAAEPGKYQTLQVTKEDGVYRIVLNRPSKKNAINYDMYEEWGQALNEAAQDNDVVLAVVTGAGDFYCSGNDLGNFANVQPGDIPAMAKKGGDILEKFVNAFIDFPKPLIALINGPAVGVSVTVLGLFDVVYATDKATFHTPFSALGQSPEGCSSYTFPKMMGTAKATELLLFNKKITAVEACERNLVTEVFHESTFKSETETRVKQYAKLPKISLQKSKNLSRDAERQKLYEVNKMECNILVERWQSEECMTAIMNFFMQKGSKL